MGRLASTPAPVQRYAVALFVHQMMLSRVAADRIGLPRGSVDQDDERVQTRGPSDAGAVVGPPMMLSICSFPDDAGGVIGAQIMWRTRSL